MMKKLLIVVVFCCLTAANAFAEGRMQYRGFIGGMMVHSGYVGNSGITVTSPSGDVHNVSMSGAPIGVGGTLKFMFGNHLRLGAEGYVSSLTYGKYKSRASTGWGGVLLDFVWNLGAKTKFFIGTTIGAGSQRNTTILSDIKDDYIAEDCISYRKYAFAAVAPFLGAEFAVSKKINIVLKADYLMNVSNPQADFVTGPRIYLGFLFGHAE